MTAVVLLCTKVSVTATFAVIYSRCESYTALSFFSVVLQKCHLVNIVISVSGCYGVSENQSVGSTVSSASTEPWFCDACKAGVKPVCSLCIY